jgi:hypothetical protein
MKALPKSSLYWDRKKICSKLKTKLLAWAAHSETLKNTGCLKNIPLKNA